MNGGCITHHSLKNTRSNVTQITNNIGNLAAEYSFDAWGRMRDVTSWNVYIQGSQPAMNYGGRGYTGHEHLNQYGLINMNARLYDPILARFLAPDPYVGSGMTNDFNRYIYGRNNPMMYTDPSGKFFWLIGALLYGGISYLAGVRDNGYKDWTPHINAISFGYSQNTGGYAGVSFDGGNHFSNMGWNNGLTAGSTSYGVTNMGKVYNPFNPEQSVVQAEQNARSEYFAYKSMASGYQTEISDWIDNHIFMESEFRVDKGYQAAADVEIAGFKVGFDVQKDTYPLFQSSIDYNRGFLGSVYSNKSTDYGILKDPLRNSWSFGGILGASKSYDYSSSFFSWGQMQSENINLGVVNVTKLFDYNTGMCNERQFSLDLKLDLSLLFGIHGKFRFGYKY